MVLSIIYRGLFIVSLCIIPIYIAKIPVIKLWIPAKNKIATNIEVVLIFPTPEKNKYKVLIITIIQTKKDRNPKINANLRGKSEKGNNAISKKPVKILNMPNLDFPWALCLLS